jgi:hypothetical protein
LKAETTANGTDIPVGKAWAEYSRAVAALGDKEPASRALDQAYGCMEKSLASQFPPVRRVFYKNLAEGYAAAAARQAAIFGPETAVAAYGRAYEYANLSVDSRDHRFGDFGFELIAAEQLTANDESGARETTKRTPTPRSAARCWLRICNRCLARGDKKAAREAAHAAAQILDRDGFEPFVAVDMALVASEAARADEKEIAQNLFRRALSLSDADASPKSVHPFIASFQAHGGLLTDAYRTIQAIPKQSDRAQPLADLCLALAKAENASRNLRP